MVHTKIARYGNSLTVRLPATLARDLDFREGDRVVLKRVDRGLVLERPRGSRLEAWLKTVESQEGEAGAGAAVGAEVED